MPNHQYHAKLAELEQIMNDPSVPFTPDRIWALLAETTVVSGTEPERVKSTLRPSKPDDDRHKP